jgi:hypothetical protein
LLVEDNTYLDLGGCLADVEVIGHDCGVFGTDFGAVDCGESYAIQLRVELLNKYTNSTATCRSKTDMRA